MECFGSTGTARRESDLSLPYEFPLRSDMQNCDNRIDRPDAAVDHSTLSRKLKAKLLSPTPSFAEAVRHVLVGDGDGEGTGADDGAGVEDGKCRGRYRRQLVDLSST